MPIVAANELITVEKFGKGGENCSLTGEAIHLWGNSFDSGLKFGFRGKPAKIKSLSLAIRGEIKFHTEWGRIRFEAYDGRTAEPYFVDEVTMNEFQLDHTTFRPFIINLGEEGHSVSKLQMMFIGPALIDIEVKDIRVE